ncbi:MAG: ThiF family adenylyltransferase [Nitrososphaera sp.]|uniref:Putative molybdopterin biosynthesis protein MoeB n=1 Tax=Nitrososphaera gargensis (strain Ga9.2) TaxID=1237085 RepID=K0IP50_NITGG|nr:ThiF family adenylyltransferase [Candidatus Nitrososphaera gargensis]AFU60509.1 putative molybdopterin biosynthesis protein MoeB [Candidatus Nitrososphaera gargensis Ga9.2]
MAKVEFVVPSVLNKGQGEKKIPLEASDLQDAFTKISEQMGDDFKRRVFDHNGKPRSLINIYINGKNMRFGGGLATQLKDGDSVYILPAVAGGAELTSEELQRYSRQVMLEEIGFEGMEKIRSAKVCVVGAGGIGNPVITQLTAMGVGKLRIVDRDVIEVTNLHRQHLYTDDDIGRVKVEAAAERLRKLNPTVEIEPVPTSVTKYTAEGIVKGFEVVIDALDSVDARYALNDACIKYNIPLIYAGAIGVTGSVCTILPNKSACLRCMFPELNEEEMPACSTEGVHPSILYLVAGIQVSEAVKIIIGKEPTLVNRLLYMDLNELSFDRVQMFRQEECPSCGRARKESEVVTRELIIEELCGRDRGKRTWTVTPAEPAPINLVSISKNAESLGYQVKTRGNLGITAINSGKMSVSFLSSGAATIVGAKDEEDAIKIYKTFVNGH